MKDYAWFPHPFSGQWVESNELRVRVQEYVVGLGNDGWRLVLAPHGWKRWLFERERKETETE